MGSQMRDLPDHPDFDVRGDGIFKPSGILTGSLWNAGLGLGANWVQFPRVGGLSETLLAASSRPSSRDGVQFLLSGWSSAVDILPYFITSQEGCTVACWLSAPATVPRLW